MEDRLEAILVEMQKLSEESRRLRAQNDRLQYAELKREFDRSSARNQQQISHTRYKAGMRKILGLCRAIRFG